MRSRAAAAPGEGAGLVRLRLGCVVGFFLVYGGLGLARYWTFHSRSLDMAYYVRLVWGVAHGRYDNPVVSAPHLLGLHAEPVLLLFAALARLGLPIAEVLLIAQAACVAAALLPAHAFARRLLPAPQAEHWAFAAALALWAAPTVTRCLDYDFHPTTMLVLPLMGWIEAVAAGRWRAGWVWLAAGLSLREDVGLQLAAAAATLAVLMDGRGAGRWQVAAMAVIGAGWFFAYALLIQPPYLGDPALGSFGAHFHHLGGGAGGVPGILRALLVDPAASARWLLTAERLLYPLLLLLSVGLLPLFAPRWLAGALPLVAVNLLSDFPGVRSLRSHYATAISPFLVAAAIEGAARLGPRLAARLGAARWAVMPVALLLAGSLGEWWFLGASPGGAEMRWGDYRDDAYSVAARRIVAATRRDEAVVAEVRLLAHLAERAEVRMLPAEVKRGRGR